MGEEWSGQLESSQLVVFSDEESDHTSDMEFSGSYFVLAELMAVSNIMVSLDEDVMALLHELERENNYSPFPDELFALLYCLLHSPNPIVNSLEFKKNCC